MADDQGAAQALAYTLCACLGTGVMLNVVLLVWHCVRFKTESRLRKMLKIGLAFLCIDYILAGLAVVLLILYRDLQFAWLCSTGGFFVLFSSAEILWTMVACGVVATLWQQIQLPWKPKSLLSRRGEHKWGVTIFVLAMLLKSIILGILSFLPLTDLDLFSSKVDYFYLCTPLRLPYEPAWAYAASLLTLDWLALLIVIAITLFNTCVGQKRLRSASTYHDKGRDTVAEDNARTFNIAFCCNAVSLGVFLLILSVSFFSGGTLIGRGDIQWLLGFSLAAALLLYPVVTLGIVLARRKCDDVKGPCAPASGHGYSPDLSLPADCPKSLLSLTKLPHKQAVGQYRVQWLGGPPQSRVMVGVMKVYPPPLAHRWRAEVSALARLAPVCHPNLARYMWESSTNPYTAAIRTFTGDALSLQSSITCRADYPNGTLHDFLQADAEPLSEVGLHKVSQDIANGLGFLHIQHIVHNGLTSKSVYMASVSEKVGLRVVVGDFENSYEVAMDTVRTSPLTFGSDTRSFTSLYSISQHIDLDNSKFAPDIRSFGLILLEIMVAIGESNQVSDAASARQDHVTLLSMYPDESDAHSLVCEEDISVDVHSPEVSVSASGNDDNNGCKNGCTCSSRVTDIRAFNEGGSGAHIRLHDDRSDVLSSWSDCGSRLSDSGKWRPPSAFTEVSHRREADVSSDGLGVHAYGESQEGAPWRSAVLSPAGSSSWEPVPAQSRGGRSGIQMPVSSGGHPAAASSGETCRDANLNLQVASWQSDTRFGAIETDVSPDFTNGATAGQDLSACSDDPYNGSLASLGSFETIYEDEEEGQAPGRQGQRSKRMTARAPGTRRKASAVDDPHNNHGGHHLHHHHHHHHHKKRYSMSSLDEDVFSVDSGVGSSHCDSSSERERHFQAITTGSTGTTGTIGATGATGTTGSAASGAVYPHQDKDCVLLNLPTPRPTPCAATSTRTSHSGIQTNSVGDLPDLRIRKRPCTSRHNDPNHPCNQHAAMQALQHFNDVISDHVILDGAQMDKSTSTDSLERNNRPSVTKLASPSVDNISLTSLSSKGTSACQTCGRHDLDLPYPQATRASYRNIIIPPPMPRLGISAVRSRRASDASINSLSTGSLANSMETLGSTAPVSPESGRFKQSLSNSVLDSFLALRERDPRAQTTLTGRRRGRTTDAEPVSSRPVAQTKPVFATAPGKAEADDGGNYPSSSVESMLQDNRLLLQTALAGSAGSTSRSGDSDSGVDIGSGSRCQGGMTSRSQSRSREDEKKGDLTQLHVLLQASGFTSTNQKKIQKILDLVKKNGRLGFIAQQLVSLLRDCWLEDPAPSTDEILRRLDIILPTASV